MKTLSRFGIAVVLIVVCSASTAIAGNGKIIDYLIPLEFVIGEDVEPEATWSNINDNFELENPVYSFTLSLGGEIKYEAYEERENLKPKEEIDINFGPIVWDGLEPGMYTARFDLTSDFDADPDDNFAEVEVEIVDGGSSWEEIRAAVFEYMETNPYGLNLDLTAAYLCPEPSPAGTTIVSAKPGEFEHTIESGAWFGWVQWDVTSGFSSRTSYVFVDDETQEVKRRVTC